MSNDTPLKTELLAGIEESTELLSDAMRLVDLDGSSPRTFMAMVKVEHALHILSELNPEWDTDER